MVGVSALAPPTAQAVSGKVINDGHAMVALVRSTKEGAQSKANSNSSGLILHA